MENLNDEQVRLIGQALSDSWRMKLLNILRKGRTAACQSTLCISKPLAICPEDLKRMIPELSSSKISYHLKILQEAQLIKQCREGKRIYYYNVQDVFYEFELWLRKFHNI